MAYICPAIINIAFVYKQNTIDYMNWKIVYCFLTFAIVNEIGLLNITEWTYFRSIIKCKRVKCTGDMIVNDYGY